jgi:hypothetical protein
VTVAIRCQTWVIVCLALGAVTTPGLGQELAVDSIRSSINRLAARLDSLEAGSCPQGDLEAIRPTTTGNPVLDSLGSSLNRLVERVQQIALARCAERVEPVSAGQPSGPPAQVRTAGSYMNIGFDGLADFGWSSEQDVSTLQLGDHDPLVRGFTIPNVELTLDGAVDPYFKGFANIVYKLDPGGETGVELEEVYVLTTSLPWNLQLKGGQFFAEFGRQNQQHPHSWSFVDQPLVLNRMFGPDGLRSQGARLSWLPPTSWYTEAMVSILNSAGGTAFSFRSDESSEIHGGVPEETGVRRVEDFLVVPRIAASFELTGTQTLLVGASGAFGPNNSGSEARTRIYGVDLYWKWKSATAMQGFPFVSFQTEALVRKYDAASRPSGDDPLVTLPSEGLTDRGIYAQLLWGIKPRLVAGLRGEAAKGDSAAFDTELRALRYRVSPNLTWYPSEFSKVRLQYNYDDREGIGTDHSIWLQFEFILGAHAAHKF